MVAGMSAAEVVATSPQVPEGKLVKVIAFGRDVLLVRYQGVVRALDDVCPHRGAPMHQGELVGDCVECPLHGWAFSVQSGHMPGAPHALETFRVEEADGLVRLHPPEGG